MNGVRTKLAQIKLPSGLLSILLVYLMLGYSAAWVVPYEPCKDPRLTPPDESAHWWFIRDLATNGKLSVFTSGGGNYEAHQPPLYYLLNLPAYLLKGEDGLVNAREWTVIIGAWTLVAAWFASFWLFGADLWKRSILVGILAFWPCRLFAMAQVGNDALAELFIVIMLLLCFRALHQGLRPPQAILMGIMLGLAFLTKLTTLVLAPIVLLTLLMEPGWRGQLPVSAQNPDNAGRRTGALLVNIVIIGTSVLLLWGWWVARNYQLYGEPLATGIFQKVFLQDRATPEFFLTRGFSWGDYWHLVLSQTWLSAAGVFGQATVYMSASYYTLMNFLAGICGPGFILAWLRDRERVLGATESLEESKPVRQKKKDKQTAQKKTEEPKKPAGGLTPVGACILLCVVLFILTLAAFMQFNTVFYQAQARYFLAASFPLAALATYALSGLSRENQRPVIALSCVFVLAIMCAWAIVAHLTGSYSFTPAG